MIRNQTVPVRKGATMSYSPDYGYGPSSSGRPVNLRWIAALIIALFGIVTYFFETQTNPVTGKKQHVAMDVDQEMRRGLESAPQMAAEMGGRPIPATTHAPGSSRRSATGSSSGATP